MKKHVESHDTKRAAKAKKGSHTSFNLPKMDQSNSWGGALQEIKTQLSI